MDDQELTALLGDLESDRVERKASTSDGKKIRQAICAFANDLPNHKKSGVLFVGVKDNGTCANLSITDELLLSLSSIRSEGKILPFPVLQVNKRILDGCELAVVIVEPSDAPPVRFDGRTYIRVGPRRATATPEEERRLNEKRRARDLPFDLQSLPSTSLADLNLEFFQQSYLPVTLAPDVLEENQRSLDQQLASARFTTPPPESCPTVLGILTIGKEPRFFVPGHYVQFLRVDGTELGDPIKDQKEISGSLLDILRILDETLQINIATASDITRQSLEIQQPDYPIQALQQLARNAVMHRSYEQTNAPVKVYWFNDRIEIQNPGGLFGQVNQANFGQGGTDYRNPHLAGVMKDLGYVQRFGYGIPTAKRALERNGNPPPEFSLDDTFTSVIIRSKP
ncbi:ATP-binding protein [Prochlorothrix hollandica]|uniref:Transcriptional regulator n=1 Tax=Prochlorothrix hollandica PCC 9006 = CALU 1027 TaxID=317619 RepID=A0A0M2Q2U9_PROHO|nr:ATP-binding protein [Prochlorothrix hollandica]KKJ00917.1 transcriptional regulator [Prochlorothrix hollandica PCC 9006 = CALU 1027]